MRALSLLSASTGLSSVADLTATRADVLLVMMLAGATMLVLPISTQGLIVLMKEQFTSNSFGDGLVYAIPGGGGLTFNGFVREMPQADGTGGEHISTCT